MRRGNCGADAGRGPALFAGWAGKDDGWSCRDMGCGCGFEYAYEPGEPMGMRWPVERTNSWLSNFGQLRRNTDRFIHHRIDTHGAHTAA